MLGPSLVFRTPLPEVFVRVLLPVALLVGCGDPTYEDLMNLTDGCDALTTDAPFKFDPESTTSADVCALEGAVWWRADFDIDCDGSVDDPCLDDPDREPTTAAVDMDGAPLSATIVPYVTIPMVSDWFDYEAEGVQLGSVAAVLWRNKLVYAPVGNLGGDKVLGEGSLALAEKLGMDTDPIEGGIDRGVTWIIFTGDGSVVTPVDSETIAEEKGIEMAKAALKANE